MPKILWLVSITLPPGGGRRRPGVRPRWAAAGWPVMLDALAPQLRLTVASVDARAKTPLSGENGRRALCGAARRRLL